MSGQMLSKSEYDAMIASSTTEAAFLALVREVARGYGWTTYHTHDSRRSEPGFPDLVLVRERVVFAELKTVKGKVTPEQRVWLAALEGAGEVYVWRPTDWDAIHSALAPNMEVAHHRA